MPLTTMRLRDVSILWFDARERWLPRERSIAGAAADRYLLDVTIRKVLSVDVLVWPTIFRCPRINSLALEDIDIGPTGLERPQYIGPTDSLWSSLFDLRGYLPARAPDRDYSIVAMSSDRHPALAMHEDASEIDEKWTFLGYDVASEFLLSGLSNCGYDPDEVSGLRACWSSHINHSHLFSSLDAAREFSRLSDRRVPEHAPFYEIGLWELQVPMALEIR